MSNKIRMRELRNLSVQYAEKDFILKFYFREWLKIYCLKRCNS